MWNTRDATTRTHVRHVIGSRRMRRRHVPSPTRVAPTRCGAALASPCVRSRRRAQCRLGREDYRRGRMHVGAHRASELCSGIAWWCYSRTDVRARERNASLVRSRRASRPQTTRPTASPGRFVASTPRSGSLKMPNACHEHVCPGVSATRKPAFERPLRRPSRGLLATKSTGKSPAKFRPSPPWPRPNQPRYLPLASAR